MNIQLCWTCVSVGRKEKSKYSQCSAGSREEEIFFLLEVCCENSDAAWQTKSCFIQGTKNNSRQWLRSCRVAGVVKEEKNQG